MAKETGANTNPLDGVISKSLDEIETLVKSTNDLISKGQDDEDLAPNDVSEDAPEADDNEGQDDSDNDQDTPEDDEGENDEEDNDPVDKSLADTLAANESVKKALEVSEFLQELVKGIGSHTDGMRADLNKSIEAQHSTIGGLAKVFEGLAKSHKAVLETSRAVLETNQSMQKSINKLNKRIAELESQPTTRKSVANAQVLDKSFAASTGNAPTKGDKLSKSEVLGKLNAEFAKGNMDIGRDILAFESIGSVEALSDTAKSILGL